MPPDERFDRSSITHDAVAMVVARGLVERSAELQDREETNTRQVAVVIDFADILCRAWPVFREAVRMGRTITYTELAGRVGPPLTRRHVHRQFLIPLGERCREAGLPDLCALVVRKDSGKPGAGWHGPAPSADPDRAWAEALAVCFAHPWTPRPDSRLLRPSELPLRLG